MIKTLNGNQFSLGTISSSHAVIGFDSLHSTVLTLRADTIESNATFLLNGFLRTASLAVSDGDSKQMLMGSNTVAYFESGSSDGTEIKIVNQSSSPYSFAGLTLAQGNVVNRITSYSGNSANSYLSGTLAFESNSPEGMLFSLTTGQGRALGDVRFSFDSQESLTISSNSISIAKAIILRGMTDNDMFAIENPVEGTIINNTTRKSLFYYKGNKWFEIMMKPLKKQKKKLLNKPL